MNATAAPEITVSDTHIIERHERWQKRFTEHGQVIVIEIRESVRHTQATWAKAFWLCMGLCAVLTAVAWWWS